MAHFGYRCGNHRLLQYVARIAVRRKRLQFDDKDAAEVVASPVVEFASDVEYLMQLRHEGQALLNLVEVQCVEAGKIAQKVIVEDGQLPILGKLDVHCDAAPAKCITIAPRTDGILD